MELGILITEYLIRLNCSAKTLAEAAGVSPIQLSRWRSGTRRPSPEMLSRLADGIAALSHGTLERDEVIARFMETVPLRNAGQQGEMGRRLDLLLRTLRVRTSEMARVLNFDPSYLSRIRSGKRNPANIGPITEGVSRFIVRRCTSEAERAAVAELIGTDAAALMNPEKYAGALMDWLRGGPLDPAQHDAEVGSLLASLDSFDLNEYIRAIRIDQPAPSDPGPMPPERSVTGLKNMMSCELDFLRAAALSDSTEPVLIYTDMPLIEMAKDPEFPKQWMQGVAELIRKGLPVQMLHNVDRPFEEMMLGLEVHIPAYMTGRITPYYLRESNSGPFRHLLEVSGAAALAGEAIEGHHAEGRYHLTFDPEELRYYHRRAEALMEKAQPLMEVYTQEREAEYLRFRAIEAEQGRTPFTLDMPAFRNVSVHVCHGHWAVVEKDSAPRVFFVIRHPKLVDALERFAPPLVDEE